MASATGHESTIRVWPGSEATTRGVRVRVEPRYLPEQSNPEAPRFVFGYKIRITNEGATPVRLLSRHWIIVDADGGREEIRGEGVVGRQPDIAPGQSFAYSSFCPLATAWGTMEGSYQVQGEYGEIVEVAIARFYLVASPGGERPAVA